MHQAMSARLDTLSATAPVPRIAIRPDSPLIQWDGNGGDADGATAGTIALDSLIALMDMRGASALTHGNTPAVATCRVERMAQAMIDEIESAAGPANAGTDGDATRDDTSHDAGDTAADGAAANEETVAAFVGSAVNRQMAPATAPEARLTYGLIPNGANKDEAQARLLETFQLRPGPTDVTAYHDFSTLQIAFEHVWTRVFDGELEELGRQVYREYVGLKDFLGYDPATSDPPISSLDDLTWLLGEVRALSQIAQDALPPANTGEALGTANVPKGTNDIAKEATKIVDSSPGGRVGAAIATLGASELVIGLLQLAGGAGVKPLLLWDDLLNGRKLNRGDRIVASIEPSVIASGNFELTLRTDDVKSWKGVAFQIFNHATNKIENRFWVSNAPSDTLTYHPGSPTFYEHSALIPSNLLPDSLLEFDSQGDPGKWEAATPLGRYVMGDLSQIIPDGGRLTLHWKDS
jgi:hypothetical protein